MSTVVINGKEYVAKYSLRALFLYERMTGHNGFEIASTEDSFRFMFAMIKANNKECELGWDGFIEAVEENPGIATERTAIINAEVAEMAKLGQPKADDGSKKK
jgi:hypothetical protein